MAQSSGNGEALAFPLPATAVTIRLAAPIPGVVEEGETLLYWPGHPDGELVAFRRRELPARALLPVLRALANGGGTVTPYVEDAEASSPPAEQSPGEPAALGKRGLDLLK